MGMSQLSIFDAKSRYEEMREQWIAYHEKHPEVWRLFQKFTFDRIKKGFEHYGGDAIMSRIRWETDQAVVDPSKRFKINNNHKPFYSRAFEAKYPEHRGFFRHRIQISQYEAATELPETTPERYDH